MVIIVKPSAADIHYAKPEVNNASSFFLAPNYILETYRMFNLAVFYSIPASLLLSKLVDFSPRRANQNYNNNKKKPKKQLAVLRIYLTN